MTRSVGVKRPASASQLWTTRQRAHDEVRAGPVDEVGERGGRLAEAHVVGEAAAEAEPVEELQPAEAAALVGPQLAGERRRFELLAAARRRAARRAAAPSTPPTRRRRRQRRVGAVADAEVVAGRGRVGGELQQGQRARCPSRVGGGELLDLAQVGVVPGADLAQRRRVDAHPAPAGVQQRRPGLLGAGQLGRGDRRRAVVVGDGEAPLHDGLAVEARPTGRSAATGSPGRARRRWRARGARGRSARCRGAPARPAPARGTRRRPRRRARRPPARSTSASGASTSTLGAAIVGQLGDHRLEHGEVVRAAGHLDGQRGAVPHVVGGAPAAGIDLVDELEVDAPRVEAVVGHDEAQAADQHRFAAGPVAEAAEMLGDRPEGVGVDGAGWSARGRPDRSGRGTRSRTTAFVARPARAGPRVPSPARAGGPARCCRRSWSKIVADRVGGARSRSSAGTSGQADRRHRLGEGVEERVDRRAGGRRPSAPRRRRWRARRGRLGRCRELRDDGAGLDHPFGELRRGRRTSAPSRSSSGRGAQPVDAGDGVEPHRHRAQPLARRCDDVERGVEPVA